MKIISFDGRVGANGTEVKMTKNCRQYARFSVANNSFINGEEKTEWFDVITYDQNFIEKRAQYLTKGSYVIINGSLKTEVNVDQSNKVWVNHHVTASTIDTPRFGGKNEQQNNQTQVQTQPVVSTYTATTTTQKSVPVLENQVVAKPMPEVSVVGASANGGWVNNDNNDDLPF